MKVDIYGILLVQHQTTIIKMKKTPEIRQYKENEQRWESPGGHLVEPSGIIKSEPSESEVQISADGLSLSIPDDSQIPLNEEDVQRLAAMIDGEEDFFEIMKFADGNMLYGCTTVKQTELMAELSKVVKRPENVDQIIEYLKRLPC